MFFSFLNYLDKIIMHLSVGNTKEKILVNLNIYKNLKIKRFDLAYLSSFIYILLFYQEVPIMKEKQKRCKPTRRKSITFILHHLLN